MYGHGLTLEPMSPSPKVRYCGESPLYDKPHLSPKYNINQQVIDRFAPGSQVAVGYIGKLRDDCPPGVTKSQAEREEDEWRPPSPRSEYSRSAWIVGRKIRREWTDEYGREISAWVDNTPRAREECLMKLVKAKEAEVNALKKKLEETAPKPSLIFLLKKYIFRDAFQAIGWYSQ